MVPGVASISTTTPASTAGVRLRGTMIQQQQHRTNNNTVSFQTAKENLSPMSNISNNVNNENTEDNNDTTTKNRHQQERNYINHQDLKDI